MEQEIVVGRNDRALSKLGLTNGHYVMVSYVLVNWHFERTSLSNQWSQAQSDKWPLYDSALCILYGHDRVFVS
jgi:hypothetical protein